MEIVDFEILKGKVFSDIKANCDTVTFCIDGIERYILQHVESWSEDVSIDDIVGDLSDLIGKEITKAEEIQSDTDLPDGISEDYFESWTYSFYYLHTLDSCVTIKFFGTSNGYYSETAELYDLTK